MNYQQEMQLKRLKNQPWMVWLLLGIQLLIFLGMTLAGLARGYGLDGSQVSSILVQYGAMDKELVIVGHEYWRLISPIFVHIGLMHLIVNSLTLYFIGLQLEGLLGHWRFLLVYLLSGISGNLLSLAFGNPLAVSAGASTSLFGLFGIFVALGRVYRYHPTIQFMAQRMQTLIIMNLIFNLFSTRIDMLGHVGGVIGGFLLGLLISLPSVKGSRYDRVEVDIHQKIRAVLILVFFIGICLYKIMNYGSF